ncbi:exonuclease domain-containing protein [Actinocatenispora comari]|uniref:Exonuclease domain-containing protein n=1 Tax=Actinocatenispora comari TaxID=2807577 RepID=A0A8J4AFX6_9ACTN|nr:exonuclease domain-containing protein [Actinocatenispora comari]GIL28947.1 hypothetical protein NUM_42010 [Actinocatenispora comari]
MAGYAVVDVETTGLHPGRHDRVVEVAVVQLDAAGVRTGEWESLINPGRDVGPTDLHGVTGKQVLAAPRFERIAGDLAALLAGRVLVGHNLRFDSDFLRHEYQLMGVDAPVGVVAGLCTMRLSGWFLPGSSRSLGACCAAGGVEHTAAHTAMGDAAATAALFQRFLAAAGAPPPWYEQLSWAEAVAWPALPVGLGTPCTRSGAEPETHFLNRLVDRLPRTGDSPTVEEYLAVLDRALLDRYLSVHEQEELVRLASRLGIDRSQAHDLHRGYLLDLARAAWQDGVVTDEERSDLVAVTALLGLPPDSLDTALQNARPGSDGHAAVEKPRAIFRLVSGDQVVLTGASEIRQSLEQRSLLAGLDVHRTVTKHTRLVCAADPDSQSGKAKKARDYGIPIVNATAYAALLAALESEKPAQDMTANRSSDALQH